MGELGGPDKAEKKDGWYFRGQNAIKAMMNHLVTK